MSQRTYTLEYWQDGEWLVGRVIGIPGVFSQGKTLKELKENIQEVFHLMTEDEEPLPVDVHPKRVEIELAV